MHRDTVKSSKLVPLAAALALTLACGGPSSEARSEAEDPIQSEVEAAQADAASEESAAAGAPQVAETYQSTINRGWEKAVEGETPAYACAGLKGRVIGTDTSADPDALEALFACNVLLPVRYFETLLDRVEAGEETCRDFRMTLSTQLPAMTLSVGSIQGMADAMAEDPEADPAETVGDTLAEATLEQGLTDPEREIKDRLRERVESTCPDLASSILR